MKPFYLLTVTLCILCGCTELDIDSQSSVIDSTPPITRVLYNAQDNPSRVVLLKFKSVFSRTLDANITQYAVLTDSRSGIPSVDNLTENLDLASFERVFPLTKYEDRTREFGLSLWYRLKFKSASASTSIINKLVDTQAFSVIEVPSNINLIDETNNQNQSDLHPYLFSDSIGSEQPFSDPLLKKQWNYHNDGNLIPDALPSADINLFEAWKRTTGDPQVVVAVIDQYVASDHPDLRANMWTNEAEAHGKPGVDDDHNGYVDDIHGFNFRDNSASSHGLSHGTHVAGLVGAVSNNGTGVSGVAGGSGKGDGVRIMTCGALDQYGGTSEQIALAIKYAADNGAVIAQNSWGYPNPYIPWNDDQEYSIQRDALKYFIEYAGKDEKGRTTGPMNGGVVIFAAGNNGQVYGDAPIWPGAHPDFIAVSSIGCDFRPAYYTNFGNWVDVAAPGGDFIFNGNEGQILSTSVDDDSHEPTYAYMQGTSMACPQVSGIAALAVSYAKQNHYPITNEELKNLLTSSCRKIDCYFQGVKNNDGYNSYTSFQLNMSDYQGLMGNGLIDASLVLDNLEKLIGIPYDHSAPNPVGSVSIVGNSPSSVSLKWQVTADYRGNPVPVYEIYYSKRPIRFQDKEVITDDAIKGPVVVNAGQLKVGDWTSVTLEELEADTEYHVAVLGRDKWNQPSEPSQTLFRTENWKQGAMVDNLNISQVGRHSIKLSWDETEDFYHQPYVSYQITCADNREFEHASIQLVKGSGKVGTPCELILKNLEKDTEYYVRVEGIDQHGVVSLPAFAEVRTLKNQHPVVRPLFEGPVDFQYWESRTFRFEVTDPENDDWVAVLTESDGGWKLNYDRVDRSYVELHFTGPVSYSGDLKVSFTVIDCEDGETKHTLDYHIAPNESPELLKSLPDMYLESTDDVRNVDLTAYFTDANLESLSFSHLQDGKSVRSVLENGILQVQGVKNGKSEITVTATDHLSESVSATFNIMVRSTRADLELYPNPVKETMFIRMGKQVEGTIIVKVRGTGGQVLMETETDISPFEPAKVDMRSVPSGQLWIEVVYQGRTYKGNIIKL